MSYKPNEKLAHEIKQRLGVLLQSKRPLTLLALLMDRKRLEHPKLKDSVLEDLVIQDLIEKYKDRKLEVLWHLYNVGYFKEDTEKYLKNKFGDDYETIVRLVPGYHDLLKLVKRVQAA